MTICETDRQIHAGPGVMQRAEALAVEPFGALAQHRVVALPGGDGVLPVDARRREDRIRKLRHRDLLRYVGEDELGPGEAWIGDDVPVGLEIRDLLQRRLIGL